MKKVLLPVLALLLSANAYNVMAANGTVKFTGEIKRSACDVTTESQNKEVFIGTYATSAFPKANSLSAAKGFQITLKECDPGDYSLRFDGKTVPGHFNLLSVSTDGAPGNSSATGVGIEIIDHNNVPLAIADGTNMGDDVAKLKVNTFGEAAVFNLKARYRSFADVVTPGLANATSTFSIEYK